MPIYKVDYSGGTTGAESGKRIEFERNEPVECEKYDLKHLGDHVEMITKSDVKTAVVEDSEKRDYPIHKGAGYYELSNGETVRGKDEAIEAQKELDK